MRIELDPDQPPAVARAVRQLLDDRREPDPWWQAGIDEALGDEDPLSAQTDAGARKSRGAARA